jgi:hypothetical protein
MRIDPIWRPLMLTGGATRGRSYVEVTDKFVSFHFGFWSRQTVDRDEVVSAAPRQWPVWYGVGWRSNLRGVIGLIGSYQGVVEVCLKNRVRAWGVFPCDRIAVSLEDPDGFIAALSGASPAKPTPVAKAVARKATPRKQTKKT